MENEAVSLLPKFAKKSLLEGSVCFEGSEKPTTQVQIF
jgi:hypothetical protein